MDWKVIDYRYMKSSKIQEWKRRVPVLLYHSKLILEWTYSIPSSKSRDGWVYHRDDGPARKWSIHKKDEDWMWYGTKAISEEQFYDLEWRKKIEIEIFL